MQTFIEYVMSNFTLTFFVLSLIVTFFRLIFAAKPLKKGLATESFIAFYILFNIGFMFIYNFICHVFYAEQAAAFIGWANSPFQYEVGYVSLGIGIAGIIAFKSNIGFRAATILIPAVFMLGAACGHISEIIQLHNFAPGNAGVMLWADILLPIYGFVLLALKFRATGLRRH